MADESSIDLWREKLAFFQAEEAVATGGPERFALKKQIEEAKAKTALVEHWLGLMAA